MSITLLGGLLVAGLAGPILRIPKRYGLPVAVGELMIGGVLGHSGFNTIPTTDPTLTLLATIGFAQDQVNTINLDLHIAECRNDPAQQAHDQNRHHGNNN